MIPRLSGVRFAPSPTGRFHIGNLRTAWISAHWARELREPWIVRFEDIDAPRVVEGSQAEQLGDLAQLGWVPDRIDVQNERKTRHWDLFRSAIEDGAVYPCTCSRKDVQTALAGIASAPHEVPPIYSGHCRTIAATDPHSGSGGVAWRFRNRERTGKDDFIVARTRDLVIDFDSFVPAYHWACAIDDLDGNFRLLVRAWDLASSIPIQREIQSWLKRFEKRELPLPSVFHTSLVVQNNGHRLEKRTAGVTLPELLQRGLSTEVILDLFSRSFRSAPKDFPPEAIFGEADRTLKLEDLGF